MLKSDLTGNGGPPKPAVREGAGRTERSGHFQCPRSARPSLIETGIWEGEAEGEAYLGAMIPAGDGRKWVCPGHALEDGVGASELTLSVSRAQNSSCLCLPVTLSPGLRPGRGHRQQSTPLGTSQHRKSQKTKATRAPEASLVPPSCTRSLLLSWALTPLHFLTLVILHIMSFTYCLFFV